MEFIQDNPKYLDKWKFFIGIIPEADSQVNLHKVNCHYPYLCGKYFLEQDEDIYEHLCQIMYYQGIISRYTYHN